MIGFDALAWIARAGAAYRPNAMTARTSATRGWPRLLERMEPGRRGLRDEAKENSFLLRPDWGVISVLLGGKGVVRPVERVPAQTTSYETDSGVGGPPDQFTPASPPHACNYCLHQTYTRVCAVHTRTLTRSD